MIDLRRRPDARVQVARLAADLFWRHGVTVTRGDDIAASAGISTRTLWRYFRSKEACVEPVLEALAEQFVVVLEGWPADVSLADHLEPMVRPGPIEYDDDQLRAMHVIHLARTEPALRSAWLMACDDAERRSVPLIAARLGLPHDDPEAQRVAAAVGGAMRAMNDDLTEAHVVRGERPDAADVVALTVRAIAEASGGRIGPTVGGAR